MCILTLDFDLNWKKNVHFNDYVQYSSRDSELNGQQEKKKIL